MTGVTKHGVPYPNGTTKVKKFGEELEAFARGYADYIGVTSIQGPRGLTGPQGDRGPTGADSMVPGPRGPKGDLAETSVVRNAITEWWTKPLSFRTTHPYDRVIFGAIDTEGRVLIGERTPYGVRTVVVGATLVPDDHSCPTPFETDDGRLGLMWTNHNRDRFLHLTVGDKSGSIDSLKQSPITTINQWDGEASYTQTFRIAHLSTADRTAYWCFTRRNNTTWGIRTFYVRHDTGAVVAPDGEYVTLVNAPNRQCYISVAEAHGTRQVFRIGWGYNPAQPVTTLYYIEVDAESGVVSSPFDPTVSGNVNTRQGIPVVDTAIKPVLEEPPAGKDRRFFYVRPGPYRIALAYAEWDQAAPEYGRYKVMEWTGTQWVTTDYGISGLAIGYTEAANYIAGAAFPDPCYDSTVATAHVLEGNKSEIRVTRPTRTGTETVVVQSSDVRMIRPYFPVNSGQGIVMFSSVNRYGTSYEDYNADVMWATLQEDRALFAPAPDPRIGLVPNGSYASGGYVPAMNPSSGFEFEAIFKAPAAAAAYEVGRRYLDGKGWFIRVTAAGDISVSVGYGTNTQLTPYVTSSAPLASTWGRTIGLRIRVDLTNKLVTRYLSWDNGNTWEAIGSGTAITAEHAAAGLQGSTGDLIVPAGVAAQNGVRSVRKVEFRTLAGIVRASVDFRNAWAAGAATYTDPAGVVWKLNGNAYVA